MNVTDFEAIFDKVKLPYWKVKDSLGKSCFDSNDPKQPTCEHSLPASKKLLLASLTTLRSYGSVVVVLADEKICGGNWATAFKYDVALVSAETPAAVAGVPAAGFVSLEVMKMQITQVETGFKHQLELLKLQTELAEKPDESELMGIVKYILPKLGIGIPNVSFNFLNLF